MREVIVIFILLSAFTINGQGLIFDDNEYSHSVAKPHLMRGDDISLPLQSSLKQFCPPPGNQLDYSTSVGWAVGWAGKTIIYARNNDISGAEIKEYIMSPAYIYQKSLPEDEDCFTGITLESGLNSLKKYGTPFLKDHLYFCNGPIIPELEDKALENRINDYTKLFNTDSKSEEKINAVKRSLYEGYPVVTGVISTPSFRRAKEFWQPTESPSIDFPGQAVCIVGYDDKKYGGAFEIINSWGKHWGNDGFMWIRYDDFATYTKYAYDLFDVPVHNTKIAGSIEFEMVNGASMPVEMLEEGYFKMKQSYKGGDAFRLFINNDDPGFLYVFGSDLTNSYFPIFPHEETISAALNYRLSRIAIPDENSLITFDNTAGTDFLCVLYAREELNIEDIMLKMEKYPGNFSEKVHAVLDPTLLNKAMDWSTDEVAFTGDAKNGNVVAIVVEFNHY